MAADFFWTFLILFGVFLTLWEALIKACKKDNSQDKYKKVIKFYQAIWTYSFFGCIISAILWIWGW